jgi:hypothetical protein
VAAVIAASAASAGRYRALVASARRVAVRRRLVELPPGHTLADASNTTAELSWVALLIAVWVAIAPWTWGYDDAAGAVATDMGTGGAVLLLTVASIVFPALSALNLVAGLWLVIAPWLVGYGDFRGAVGLSDTIAGVVLCAVAIASLVAAERAATPGQRAIGRIRVRE